VATVAVGKAGATNAGILAVQILATGNPALRRRLDDHKRALGRKVSAMSKRARTELQRLLPPDTKATKKR
jgi:phosphoribosylcarboxyaminoimidazole (NCAIR) mutase